MTTEKTSKNTPAPAVNDNKTVFGPLGKYAIVAVIMVSIIVTTAIMLDRQLNTVDEQIAAIKEDVTETQAAKIDTVAVESTTAGLTTIESNAAVNTEIKEEVASETLAIQTTQVAAPVAAVTIPLAAETNLNTEQTNSTTNTQFKMAATKNSAQVAKQARHARLTKENQARIDAYKLEQKQYMTDMFARIKTLESQQLNRYKANQDSQIVRLRKQISQQQQMIEALVLRNKDLFELRAANMQRNQANREQRLNRI